MYKIRMRVEITHEEDLKYPYGWNDPTKKIIVTTPKVETKSYEAITSINEVYASLIKGYVEGQVCQLAKKISLQYEQESYDYKCMRCKETKNYYKNYTKYSNLCDECSKLPCHEMYLKTKEGKGVIPVPDKLYNFGAINPSNVSWVYNSIGNNKLPTYNSGSVTYNSLYPSNLYYANVTIKGDKE